MRIHIPTVVGSERPRGEEGATELHAVEVGVEAVDLRVGMGWYLFRKRRIFC